ncbi:MAG TPA: glycosyltransferase family 39 protein, partial [Chloroflexota bacterium]|nr:glycosyltransferase family 39 protein [Chloroflexota bacterium]
MKLGGRFLSATAAGCGALVLFACLLSVALRLPFLSVPLTDDEAGYAYVSSWLAQGFALYRDLWFDRPQGIFILYGGILWLFGDDTEGIRLAAALYNAVTVLAVYTLGRRLTGPRGAFAASFAYAAA